MPLLELNPSRQQVAEGEQSLRNNPYAGRIAMIGVNLSGDQALMAYVLMGRSDPSKNRIFVEEDNGAIRTTAPGKTPEEMAATENSNLIYYRAMQNRTGVFVVSNGAQTGPVLDRVLEGYSLGIALEKAPVVDGVNLSTYEPDAPNDTPRIAGAVDFRSHSPISAGLTIVRKGEGNSTAVRTSFVTPSIKELRPGVGYAVQTYNRNGDPLPSFDQPAYPFPMGADAQHTAGLIWDALNPEFRVSVVVQSIAMGELSIKQTFVINGLGR